MQSREIGNNRITAIFWHPSVRSLSMLLLLPFEAQLTFEDGFFRGLFAVGFEGFPIVGSRAAGS